MRPSTARREKITAGTHRFDDRRVVRIASPILRRNRLMSTSMLRSSEPALRPWVRSSNCSRVKTRPARSHKTCSSENSGAGQHDVRPLRVPQFAHHAIDLPAQKRERAGTAINDRRGGVRPPQHRPDTRQQLTRIERLCEIIIRPYFQPDDAIELFAPGRQHDNRHFGARSQPSAERQPILARQHQIEHDEVDAAVLERPVQAAAVGKNRNVQIVGAQIAADKAAYFGVIFHNENMRRRVHRCLSAANGAVGEGDLFLNVSGVDSAM